MARELSTRDGEKQVQEATHTRAEKSKALEQFAARLDGGSRGGGKHRHPRDLADPGWKSDDSSA